MKISMPSLPNGRQKYHTIAPAKDYGEFAAESDLKFAAPIEETAVVDKMNDQLYVTVTVSTKIKTECARCVEPITIPVDGTVEALFVPEKEEDKPESRSERAEAESQRVLYYTGGVIELDELVIEALELAIPMKPLCQPDCKGLCPNCGKNLNEGPCKCKVDEGFQPFKKLFKK